MDGERHFVVGGFQRRGRLPLELGDHTRGDRETEQVADHLLDLSLAETVAAGERGQHGLQIRPETARGDSFWKAPTRRYAAVGAGKAMKSVLVDQRFDLGQLGDLVNQRSRVVTGQGLTAATAIRGPTIGDRATFSAGTKRRCALRCPGCPPRFRPEGGVGGLRLNPMGSDEGGLEELVELSLSRPSRSPTRCSSSAIRPLRDSNTARMATWASAGTVFQSGSGIGG